MSVNPRRIDRSIPMLIIMMLVLWLSLSAAIHTDPFGPTGYNTYTLQALSWLQGHTWVENHPALELAIKDGQYYVSFPPLPSVILLPFAWLWGTATPENGLVKCYACLSVLFLYRALKNAGYREWDAVLWAFLAPFSSCFLCLTLNGAVWYHAQTLAFMLVTLSIYCLTVDHMMLSLFFYALSVACRPFDALYGIVLFLVYWDLNRKAGRTLWEVLKALRGGIALGLGVAIAIGAYNAVRFGNPLEFGHNYLPEFSFQGGVQFSLDHVAKNIGTFVFGLPFTVSNGQIEVQRFGFSFLLACPVLTCMLFWFGADLVRRRCTLEKTAVLLCFAVHLFLLLLHRTFGGYQFGARYCTDLIPYAFLYKLLRDHTERTALPEWIFLGVSFVFMIYGSLMVHL